MSLPYFTLPKMLDTDPRYANLSVEAKYLYAHLRDRLKLSVKNGWSDPLGYYVKMARESMAALLRRSKPFIRKLVGQLKEAGLIVDIRMGLTRCNRIYVQLLPGESIDDFRPKSQPETPASSAEKPPCPPERNPAFPSEGNALSPSKPNPSKPNPSKQKNWKWFISEGTKWFDADGRIWQFIDGEVAPYLVGDEHRRATADLLAQLGMA